MKVCVCVCVCVSSQGGKMLQLHLACEQRIGVIIVGPSGSGKSTLWGVLERAYEKLGRKPHVYRMNPKAMARQQVCACLHSNVFYMRLGLYDPMHAHIPTIDRSHEWVCLSVYVCQEANSNDLAAYVSRVCVCVCVTYRSCSAP